MKIWRNLECGYHVHYSNKRDAVKGLKKAIVENGDWGDHSEHPQRINVPTSKKGLIEFLNDQANHTGWSTR